MKVVSIIQARTMSRRLPNKVLLDIYGTSLLERVIAQARKIQKSDELWVVTTVHDHDEIIGMICERNEVHCYRGSMEDVRSRFHHIAGERNADMIVRITADNPLTEPEYADELIDTLMKRPELDYAKMAFPSILDGTGTEVFTFEALEKSVSRYHDIADCEHVTTAIRSEMNTTENTPSNPDLVPDKPYFVGVDTFEDYKRSCRLFKTFGNRDTLKQIIKKLNSDGKIF